jgi:hypothetical protein
MRFNNMREDCRALSSTNERAVKVPRVQEHGPWLKLARFNQSS